MGCGLALTQENLFCESDGSSNANGFCISKREHAIMKTAPPASGSVSKRKWSERYYVAIFIFYYSVPPHSAPPPPIAPGFGKPPQIQTPTHSYGHSRETGFFYPADAIIAFNIPVSEIISPGGPNSPRVWAEFWGGNRFLFFYSD